MDGSNFWDVLAAFAWPAAFGALLVIYRSNFTQVIDALTVKFERASEIKFGSIELKGAVLDPSPDGDAPSENGIAIDGNDYSREKATPAEQHQRDEIYNKTRSLMLVHRIRPSQKKGQEFDISIFLARKTSKDFETARFSHIDYVEYYLGSFFGGKPRGSKFIVRAPDSGFAMTTSAYGSPL